MKSNKKLNIQNKNKHTGATVLEILIFVAIIALTLLIIFPGLTTYKKASSHASEIGLVNSIYKSSLSAVARQYTFPKSTIKPLNNSTDNICEINTDSPFVQDIIRGVNKNVKINVYSYNTFKASSIPDNLTDSWSVFVKSNNGVLDSSGTIYIIAPESMNCYSNGEFTVTLNSNS